MRYLKVGELARETGLTVRTLHHWDAEGLVSPTHRTPSGHRLYGEADVARLQQVTSLRQLGLSVGEVRDCLGRPGFSPLRTVELHMDRVRQQMELQRSLLARLTAVADRLRMAETVSAEDFLRTIEATTMFDKYFTPEQQEQVRQRGEQVGSERIREVEAEWPRLIAEVREAIDRGDDPAGEHAQGLARRWMGLVGEFTGGDPGLSRSLGEMYQGQPEVRQQYGLDPDMFQFIGAATKAGQAQK
ncbi:MAG TPA: MerR family transcriptional regulator [Longimicrobiaceae bacterium]|nr:MerR family transcriptional regulator [Longimicrobiaceae bacterium]